MSESIAAKSFHQFSEEFNLLRSARGNESTRNHFSSHDFNGNRSLSASGLVTLSPLPENPIESIDRIRLMDIKKKV